LTAKERIIILDTSAFIAGFDPLTIQDEQYSVPLVKDELVSESLPWTRLTTAVGSSKLKVKQPSMEFVDEVKETSKKVGFGS
jgi:rRNA maturation endonuclease Nob1